MSATVQKMIDDGSSGIGVALHNITSRVLTKVIEYCKKHCPSDVLIDEEELKAWDIEFVNNMEIKDMSVEEVQV
ncbi:SKP1-like protein 13 [Acorus calamus]|uniref:SKP1-like protein 13 n=1 Tax=Acorus calamus TaxID=4465 RepID=A0AAV9E5S8_ACOCL|nr:SKP1-like protein 13 [Acorus calamus]